MTATSSAGIVQLAFESVRNLTSPDEKKNGTRTYFANIPAPEILKLDTVENLRQYIPELRPGKRNKVHEAIGETIRDNPDEFIVLNSGFTICASECIVNEDKKEIRLRNSSLINGAQSQGEIGRYFRECEERGESAKDFYVRAEIIVAEEPDFVTEVAIARNTATKVSELAQAGKRAKFDDLETSFVRVFPDAKLRKSDTDPIDTIDTERVIQLCAAMMPPELVGEDKFVSSKLKAYKNKAQCRVDFEKSHDELDKDEDKQDKRLVELYNFYVDMAPHAWHAYQEYRTHSAWRGKRLRKETKAVKRKSNHEITIADGLIFPIISALALFVHKRDGHWELTKPSVFKDEDLIDAAVEQFREGCNSDPVVMGRSAGAYQSLMLVPKMSLRFQDTQ
ncbi:AIPR family protein [Bradyrhizobium lablabi]|uniref:AIPR family protein n=1 Tax=Bradyrhizobium lablabi TaxID=722472 RepID=UPI001BA5B3D2|nr:AIPR family protein [Bradyrhizobium lablabi]MBR0698037.1 AIPR family protein [Bradyrhizobium lablabi]